MRPARRSSRSVLRHRCASPSKGSGSPLESGLASISLTLRWITTSFARFCFGATSSFTTAPASPGSTCGQAPKSPDGLSLGERLSITSDYLASALDELNVVGVGLGSVAWSAWFPDERSFALHELHMAGYALLVAVSRLPQAL